MLFPFHVPVYVPRVLYHAAVTFFSTLRVISPRIPSLQDNRGSEPHRHYVKLRLPMGLTTAPLGGMLLLLAATAIGRREIKDGTIGANNVVPLDIVAFALTMGYVVNSIDASGLVRYASSIVLRRYGRNGRKLFSSLYVISFLVGCLFGNDAVIQIGLMFLSYMTRISANLHYPRAWIYTHFAIANVASAIFVSSSTTNVVIAQAFHVSFAVYAANVAVPVLVAVVVLLPFLLYLVFADENLIPMSIEIHSLPVESMARAPRNPNIDVPTSEEENDAFVETQIANISSLEEIMNPFMDKASAVFGVVIMISTLIVLLAMTAAGLNDFPVFWATLPAAFVMFCWGTVGGWINRNETRTIARLGREEAERRRAEKAASEEAEMKRAATNEEADSDCSEQQERVTLTLVGHNFILQVSGSPGTPAGEQDVSARDSDNARVSDGSDRVE